MVAMTILFQDDFESNDFSAWTGKSGTNAIVQSGIVHSGGFAASGSGLSTEFVYKTIPSSSIVYARAYVRWSVIPLGLYLLFWLRSGGTTSASKFYVQGRDPTGGGLAPVFAVEKDASGVRVFSAIQTINPNTWYCVEVMHDRINGILDLYLDGVLIIHLTGQTGMVNIDEVRIVFNATSTMYVDDVVVSDAYIGPGLPPATATLTYQSNPIAVSCTVNGQTLNSGEAIAVPLGTSVTVSVPSEVTV